MKVNLGCGDFYADGWINVDVEANDKVKPDRIADLYALPADFEGLTHVYLGHVLEHIEYDHIPTILADLRTRMAPDGTICIVGPDCEVAEELFRRGQITQETLDGAKFGGGRWQHDVHLWQCTELKILQLLQSAGFDAHALDITSPVLDEWPVVSRIGWQCVAIGLMRSPNA